MWRVTCHWTSARTSACRWLVALLLVSSPAVTEARADLLAYEGFDYAVGSELFASNGGSGWGGAWADYGPASVILVGDGSLPYSGVPASGNHAFAVSQGTQFKASLRTLQAPILVTTHDTVWVSFLVAKTEGPADSVGMLDLYNGNRHLLGIGDVQFDPGQPGNWGLDAAGIREVSGVLADDTVRLLVTQIDLGNRQAHLWIDPAINGGVPPLLDTAHVSIDFRGTGFDNIELWLEGGGYRFDELRIATTFASVVAVPEPSSWLLMAAVIGFAMATSRLRTTSPRGGVFRQGKRIL